MSNSMEDFMRSVYEKAGKAGRESSHEDDGGSRQKIMRKMPDASCSGRIKGSCGESMEIYLKVEGETIIDASFMTDGCQFSVLCGYVATRLAKGVSIEDAARIEGDTILKAFKEMPESETHCAFLAAESLHAAIHGWMTDK